MVKTIVAVVIALVLLNTVWFVLKIAVLIWTEAKEEKKWRMGPVYQSEAREAFIMECSQKDIKGKGSHYCGIGSWDDPYIVFLCSLMDRHGSGGGCIKHNRQRNRSSIGGLPWNKYDYEHL
ncbi:hypothetical protein [Agathobacter rectalis]|uniref:SCP domain-containing protein n=1 Tax=Agathobacter rectalis TaxID=39491 RepID=A0AAW4U6W6_9FIRM|nr:hypothetical protein [Agathobacter rectalis]MCB6937510.1 hypothetical protein [Agathobacter rectalis]MCQ4889810.1 hypothetical protein [Agathobacter rectalis]